jgi:stress response protein YsnF
MSQRSDTEVRKKTEAVTREERQRATQDLNQPRPSQADKDVATERVVKHVPRDTEDVEVERVDPEEEDSGEIETLPDGSISIPILEEELVITKRVVVRERIIVRKRIEKEQVLVEADLRRERVSIVADPDVELHNGDSS